ncbi:MAG: AAA family ATPase [Desulfovibrio sp.]|nr:AAA family ATPase [Desulfovibrio sp.]
MRKFAIYGKGGIGKSTTCANLALVLTGLGKKVLQIGCDPKADSTLSLHPGQTITPVLRLLHEKKQRLSLEEAVHLAPCGVYCVEAGGPIPGLGCAGRGIGMVLEFLEREKAYSKLGIDCVLYDVLGDVVCGGFSMPMRKGQADYVLIVSSGEKMSCYAAANIAQAIANFQGRGYAALGGLIVNRRDVEDEEESVKALSQSLGCDILGDIPHSPLVTRAEREGKTVISLYPQSDVAQSFQNLAQTLLTRFADKASA